MSFADYHQAVKFLESAFNLPIKDYLLGKQDRSFYLKRLNWFLASLGNPQNGFKVIHLTGTAGKGTTVNLLHEMLSASGKKVGSYFSPHATTTIERIKVNRRYIAPQRLSDLLKKLQAALAKTSLYSPYGLPSYFEILLALAWLYFKEQKCEYVILEAGLGGRHDATNIVKRPVICAITNINYDHTDILGRSLNAIAQDKAGIIKKGSCFFTAETRLKILKIFHKRCRRLKVPLIKVGALKNEDANYCLASAMARRLGLKEKFIKQGLKRAKLPCRLEIMQNKPMVILDGAHNPCKMAFLANKLKGLKIKKLTVLLGLAQNKDYKNSLSKIVPLADRLIITRFLMPERKTADLKKLYQIAKKIKPTLKPLVFLDPGQALSAGLKLTAPDEGLLICGSFFLAGELRTRWISEKQILSQRKSF